MTRPAAPRSRARERVAWVLVGAVLTLVVGAVPAAAHDVLTGTAPADGEVVGPTPAMVVLTFDQPAVAIGTQVIVTGPSGEVQVGAPRLVDSTVTQDVTAGAPAGAYTVAWRVTSADGHPVTGTFGFTSTQAGAGTPAPAGPADPGPSSGTTSAGRGPSGFQLGAVGAAGLGIAVTVVALVRRRT